MNYNIEFQIASIIFVTILMVVFYSKKRWPSAANVLFRIIMTLVFFVLALDIISVITITDLLAGNENIETLNNFVSKLYLIVMIAYIVSVVIYTIVNTMDKKQSQKQLTFKYVEIVIWSVAFVVAALIIISSPLLYGGSGKWIYSYGPASDVVYVFSSISVAYVLLVLLVNCRRVPFKRLVPIIAFSVMEGTVALIQMKNKELLIIGLGIAVTTLIMYFALENPDMNMIEELNKANKRSRDLLLNILPLAIANKLEYEAKPFFEEVNNVTVMFIDIVGFTKLCSEAGGTLLVKILNEFFSELDDMLVNFKIEKIKTIGDAYMVAAGIPDQYANNCEETIKFARQVLRLLKEFNTRNKVELHVRIGINNGRVIAGVIGKKKYIYDLWGETVNLASRIESLGVTDRINVSERVKYLLGDQFEYDAIENVEAKGIGKITTYLLK